MKVPITTWPFMTNVSIRQTMTNPSIRQQMSAMPIRDWLKDRKRLPTKVQAVRRPKPKAIPYLDVVQRYTALARDLSRF